jgi:hypothetical protein
LCDTGTIQQATATFDTSNEDIDVDTVQQILEETVKEIEDAEVVVENFVQSWTFTQLFTITTTGNKQLLIDFVNESISGNDPQVQFVTLTPDGIDLTEQIEIGSTTTKGMISVTVQISSTASSVKDDFSSWLKQLICVEGVQHESDYVVECLESSQNLEDTNVEYTIIVDSEKDVQAQLTQATSTESLTAASTAVVPEIQIEIRSEVQQPQQASNNIALQTQGLNSSNDLMPLIIGVVAGLFVLVLLIVIIALVAGKKPTSIQPQREKGMIILPGKKLLFDSQGSFRKPEITRSKVGPTTRSSRKLDSGDFDSSYGPNIRSSRHLHSLENNQKVEVHRRGSLASRRRAGRGIGAVNKTRVGPRVNRAPLGNMTDEVSALNRSLTGRVAKTKVGPVRRRQRKVVVEEDAAEMEVDEIAHANGPRRDESVVESRSDLLAKARAARDPNLSSSGSTSTVARARVGPRVGPDRRRASRGRGGDHDQEVARARVGPARRRLAAGVRRDQSPLKQSEAPNDTVSRQRVGPNRVQASRVGPKTPQRESVTSREKVGPTRVRVSRAGRGTPVSQETTRARVGSNRARAKKASPSPAKTGSAGRGETGSTDHVARARVGPTRTRAKKAPPPPAKSAGGRGGDVQASANTVTRARVGPTRTRAKKAPPPPAKSAGGRGRGRGGDVQASANTVTRARLGPRRARGNAPPPPAKRESGRGRQSAMTGSSDASESSDQTVVTAGVRREGTFARTRTGPRRHRAQPNADQSNADSI